MVTPADRLRRARQVAGYDTPADAARAFGWSLPTYYGHENGSRGLRQDAAKKYSKAFRVSAAWLLTGEGSGDPKSERAATLVSLYDQLGDDQQQLLLNVAVQLAGKPRAK